MKNNFEIKGLHRVRHYEMFYKIYIYHLILLKLFFACACHFVYVRSFVCVIAHVSMRTLLLIIAIHNLHIFVFV